MLIEQTLAKYGTKAVRFLREGSNLGDQFKTAVSKEQLNPFDGLGSAYLQAKFIEEHFPYVVNQLCT